MKRCLREFSLEADAAEVNDRYLSFLAGRADVYEGAHEILEELAEGGDAGRCDERRRARAAQPHAQAGLEKYFDGVFVSSKVGASKPSRKIFEAALKSLGVENRAKVLMIGDSLKADILGAKNAGLASCWCKFPAPARPGGHARDPRHRAS